MFLKYCSILLIFPIVAFCSLTKLGPKPTSCPTNEVPTDCVEYCLPTCEKPKQPVCTYISCYGGCTCKEGYIRKSERGECVPISSCVDPDDISRNYTEPCQDNEVLGDCKVCEQVCNVPPIACTLLYCAAGCVCKEGFIRKTEDGACIPKNQC